MKHLDHSTVKSLELRAPRASTSDCLLLHSKVQKKEIFKSFEASDRMLFWSRLQSYTGGLIPTLYSFWRDFNFMDDVAYCLKQLVKVPAKQTISRAFEQCYSQLHQDPDHCLIQKSHDAFVEIPGDIYDRVELGLRQLALCVMRNLPELKPGSVKIEPKGRKISAHEKLVAFAIQNQAWCDLCDLATKLGFDTHEIRTIKQRQMHALNQSFETDGARLDARSVTSGPGEDLSRRCGRPFRHSYDESRTHLFIIDLNEQIQEQSKNITPLFIRKYVYLAFYGRAQQLQVHAGQLRGNRGNLSEKPNNSSTSRTFRKTNIAASSDSIRKLSNVMASDIVSMYAAQSDQPSLQQTTWQSENFGTYEQEQTADPAFLSNSIRPNVYYQNLTDSTLRPRSALFRYSQSDYNGNEPIDSIQTPPNLCPHSFDIDDYNALIKRPSDVEAEDVNSAGESYRENPSDARISARELEQQNQLKQKQQEEKRRHRRNKAGRRLRRELVRRRKEEQQRQEEGQRQEEEQQRQEDQQTRRQEVQKIE